MNTLLHTLEAAARALDAARDLEEIAHAGRRLTARTGADLDWAVRALQSSLDRLHGSIGHGRDRIGLPTGITLVRVGSESHRDTLTIRGFGPELAGFYAYLTVSGSEFVAMDGLAPAEITAPPSSAPHLRSVAADS